MKAIAVLRHPGDSVETAPRMQLIADSAMVAAGRPLFCPISHRRGGHVSGLRSEYRVWARI